MNIETLKNKLKPQPFQWQGETVWLKKLSAKQGMELAVTGETLAKTADSLTPEQDREATIDFYANWCSKSVCEEDGSLTLDSDEGRAALSALDFASLVSLGSLVLEHNGMSESKKNSPQPSDSLTGSAATLESNTQTTSTSA